MNKLTTAFAAVLLATALAGCADPPMPPTPATQEAPATVAPAYRACLMTDEGPADAGTPIQQARAGLERARVELGVEVAQVAANPATYASALQSLVDAGCQTVIGLGADTSNAVEAAARTNPGVRFALVDATPNSTPANLRPVLFSSHQSAFLAGYLAASRTTTGSVGAFGGLKVPEVTIYLDGFVQGVAHHNQVKATQVRVLGWDLVAQDGTFVRSTTSAWNDPEAGRAAAASLAEQGADIILAVAGDSGRGALELAQQSTDLQIIWSQTDGCITEAAFCDQVLGSVVKHRDTAILELIRADQSGRAGAGVFTAALRNDGTGLVAARPGAFGEATSAELDALAEEIIQGTIEVTSPAAIG